MGVAVGASERHDDPVLEPLGHTSRPLPHRPGENVGLLEIGVIGVENQRTWLPDVVLEDPGDALIPPLRHPGAVLDRDRCFRIEVDLVVRRRQNVKVERFVLDLVPPEVLGVCTGRHTERRDEKKRRKPNEGACHRSSRDVCGLCRLEYAPRPVEAGSTV